MVTTFSSRDLRLACCILALLSAGTAAAPALAQQKTGPGITGDDSLTWHGITLYGVIDVGVQYDTHSAPFSPLSSGRERQHRAAEQRTGRRSG